MSFVRDKWHASSNWNVEILFEGIVVLLKLWIGWWRQIRFDDEVFGDISDVEQTEKLNANESVGVFIETETQSETERHNQRQRDIERERERVKFRIGHQTTNH